MVTKVSYMNKEFDHPLFKLFKFHSPTRLVFGLGSRATLPKEVSKYGKNVLLVSDAFIKEIYSELVDILTDSGLDVELYNKIKGEPSLETVNDALSYAKEKKPDVVVGVGGGSTMDTAKIIAAKFTNEIPIEEMIGVDNVPNKAIPLILLPTTAGTGSEINRTAMLIIDGAKKWIMSENIAARVAIVDPELTVTCPPRVTAFTGMDALAHAIEGYMSVDANCIVDALALEVSRLVNKYLVRSYSNGKDIEARYYMSLAATMAGLILCSTGAVYAHSVSYTLVRYGVPHGLGVGFALPYAMEINLPVIPEKLARLAESFEVKEGGIRDKALAVISAVRRISKDVNIPKSLKDMDVPKEDLKMLAKELIEKYPRRNNPRFLTYEDATRLYEAMWNGESIIY